MTDVKEPAAIAALREVVHPTSVGTVPIVYADILQAWDTLTRERDEAVKRRREIDDEAFDYAEQIETLRTQLAAARTVTDAMVERAAKASYEHETPYFWRFASQVHTRSFLSTARAALTAALTQGDA
jgi:hypothetical protein